jgi:hypothetical protein
MILVTLTRSATLGSGEWSPALDAAVKVYYGDELPSLLAATIDGDSLEEKLSRALRIARALDAGTDWRVVTQEKTPTLTPAADLAALVGRNCSSAHTFWTDEQGRPFAVGHRISRVATSTTWREKIAHTMKCLNPNEEGVP